MTTPTTREGWHPIACIGITVAFVVAFGVLAAFVESALVALHIGVHP